jgi:two-component sensor histidine kinase
VIDRLSEFELPERLAAVVPRWATQAVVALLCVAAISVVRVAVDLVLPGAVPFTLLFPAVCAATLLAGWPAGAMALAIGALLVWRYVLGPAQHMAAGPTDAVSFVLFFISAGIIIAISSAFRVSARRMAAERLRQIEERDLLLREFNHRIKNDFQIIGSIVQLQARRTVDEPARAALQEAVERMHGVARFHANLYAAGQEASEIDLGDYLQRLCEGLRSSRLGHTAVSLRCEAQPRRIGRDEAATIGLMVNELVTNAIKHAFPNEIGMIVVRYEAESGRLTVADDGRGLPPDFDRASGVGRKLVEALARQLGGSWRWRSENGARFELDPPAGHGAR